MTKDKNVFQKFFRREENDKGENDKGENDRGYYGNSLLFMKWYIYDDKILLKF